MTPRGAPVEVVGRLVRGYTRLLKALVMGVAGVAGACVLGMMLLTCADVVLRAFGRPIAGTVDLIRIMGALTLACALPYTTAVKGHVAIEYFFHKLNRRGRVAVDTLTRAAGIAMFVALSRQCIVYGGALRRSGEVSPTLSLPVFWVPWAMAGAFALVALVILHNLAHPGREMIKP